MRLTLLHTAEAHSATFDALRDRIAPGVEINHVVRPDWLERAQTGISRELSAEITDAITATPDQVICTCTTLGPIAASAEAIRIDQPMMQAAAEAGGPVVMAYCLESTREPSLNLLTAAMDAAGNRSEVFPLPLPELWPLFEAGRTGTFARAIARAIGRANIPSGALVVLAQASMAGAAPLLADLGVPVLASPKLAFQSAMAQI